MTRSILDAAALHRRSLLRNAALGAAGVTFAGGLVAAPAVRAQAATLKVGLMLPYSGTFAGLGEAITAGFKMAVGDSLGGTKLEIVQLDDESEPAKATDNTTRLLTGDKVDVLIGTVHSGVAATMARISRDRDVLTIIPNAGSDALTGALCAPKLFRSSFSNWQPGYAMGKHCGEIGIKRAFMAFWDYGAGKETSEGFRQSFTEAGGEIIGQIGIPFPQTEFQAAMTEIARLQPDAVFCFFAGGGAVKWVKDYDAAGLKGKVPLLSSGFLTEGVTQAQGASSEGLQTTLHYADTLEHAENVQFRAAYKAAAGREADVYAVQGFDAGQLLKIGLEAAGGDPTKKDMAAEAMRAAEFMSPRGPFKLSKAGNPVQNFYLREVKGGVNTAVKVVVEGLADPATGCTL